MASKENVSKILIKLVSYRLFVMNRYRKRGGPDFVEKKKTVFSIPVCRIAMAMININQ